MMVDIRQTRLIHGFAVCCAVVITILYITYVSIHTPTQDHRRYILQYGKDYKRILTWTPLYSKMAWLNLGKVAFTGCEVDKCLMTFNRDALVFSDAVLFHIRELKDGASSVPAHVSPHQRFVFYSYESPMNTYIGSRSDQNFQPLDDLFNWTMTYRSDSDIPLRYGFYRTLNVHKDKRPYVQPGQNRTKLVLWYASNCQDTKHARIRYNLVHKLKKFIPVDIVGGCGKTDHCHALRPNPAKQEQCIIQSKQQYKFYLAFENSACKDYVTEKFWGALYDGVVPVVVGAPYADVKKVAPPDSFIHADNFTNLQALADYLLYLHKRPKVYNRYYKWREKYHVTLDSPFCHLCKALHQTDLPPKQYKLSQWWNVTRQCSQTLSKHADPLYESQKTV